MTLRTEEQALECWCPLARGIVDVVSNEAGGTYPYSSTNRDQQDRPISRCIGSACMAFRWFDPVTDDGHLCTPRPSAMVRRDPDKERPLAERRGFCGAFGKPE